MAIASSLSPDQERALVIMAEKILAERHLHEFVRQAWHVVEPATPFVDGWHIAVLCDHLEQVADGKILNLLLNFPPRHMKSLLVSVFWPAWVWTRRPHVKWLFSSYAQSLSVRDSVKMRRLIESPWYQERWGSRVRLTSDQNEKLRFDNTATGYRLATSVDGSNTGEGGDIIVGDDPHNVREGESEHQRQTVIDWWDGTMSTRGNDPKTAARVIVMQRVHEKDLSGHVLAMEQGYVHLCLPAEYEPDHPFCWPGDPRRKAGELLWPERFGRPELERLKAQLGSYRAAGQLQQRPAPREGGMFKRHWFAIVDHAPAIAARVRCWDNAGTEGAGDYTAGVLLAKAADGIIYVEDVVRGQWSAHQRDAIKLQTAQLDRERYGNGVLIHNEQEGGSSGKDVAKATVRMLAGFPVTAERSTGEKKVRAEPFAAQAEAGNVMLVSGPWNRDYIDELAGFDTAAHDDQVDASSGAYMKLLNRRVRTESRRARDFSVQTGAGGREAAPLVKPLAERLKDAEAPNAPSDADRALLAAQLMAR